MTQSVVAVHSFVADQSMTSSGTWNLRDLNNKWESIQQQLGEAHEHYGWVNLSEKCPGSGWQQSTSERM